MQSKFAFHFLNFRSGNPVSQQILQNSPEIFACSANAFCFRDPGKQKKTDVFICSVRTRCGAGGAALFYKKAMQTRAAALRKKEREKLQRRTFGMNNSGDMK